MKSCLGQDFFYEDMDSLTEMLRALATDGNKHRAKVDKRKQRSVFRDVLRAVEVSLNTRAGFNSIRDTLSGESSERTEGSVGEGIPIVWSSQVQTRAEERESRGGKGGISFSISSQMEFLSVS